jgi:hypothetical protein
MASGGHSPMGQPAVKVVIAIVALSMVVSAGPTLIALAHAAVPLIIVGGIVAAVLRLVFFHTHH